MQSCGSWGLTITWKARPPKLTTCPSRMGKEDSGRCGGTEAKVAHHKVVAGSDQYPSSLRGRNSNLLKLISVFPVCTIAPGTKLELKKYLMKGIIDIGYNVEGP